MPEGHTIHRLARDHRRDLLGQELSASSPQGRFAEEARQLSGRQLTAIEAHGKHLGYRWEGDLWMHVHLGLYGKFRRLTAPFPEPRGQVRLRTLGAERGFDLVGPNACELLDASQWQAIRDRLGPDPLRSDADPELVWDRVRRSRAPLGALLLNQAVIAGVGNVYRSEALFLQGVSPLRLGKDLTRDEFDRLWQTLCDLLRIGVRYNRIIVADPSEVGKPRGRMTRHERLLIYKKTHCVRCAGPIATLVVGARKAFACTTCQT
jgi:endonuclease-8